MAEFEELRLTVTLVDNASAGMARLRGEVTLLGQAASLAAHGMATGASSAINFGNVAQATLPKVRSTNAAMRELQRSAMDTGRALGQMAIAAQGGVAGLPRLALGAWDAAGGMKGISTALQTLAPASRIAILGIGGFTLGVTVVVTAVIAYGITVFRFAREMDQLGRTARALGMSLGQLKGAQDQAKAFGHSADSVVRSFQGIQAAQLDLYKNNSQLRQRLLAQGVSNDWINQLATADPRAAREMIARYGKALERQALDAGVGANIAAAIRNQFYGEYGQTATDMELALKPIDPKKQAELDRIEELSAQVSAVWGEIDLKLQKMSLSVLSAGLPVVLGALRLIDGLLSGISKAIKWLNTGLEKIGTNFWELLKLVPGVSGAIILLEQLHKYGGGKDEPAKPGGKKPQKLPLWKPTSFNEGNETSQLLHYASAVDLIEGNERNATETGKVTGQLEKLNAFFDRMETDTGGGGGGGARIMKASFGGGGGYGTGAGTGVGRGDYGGGGGDRGHPGHGPGPGPPGSAGAMGGTVHGYGVDAYGGMTGKTLFEPMTGWMGGGLGGHSAKFGPGHHMGVDIMGPIGSKVYATQGGIVVQAPVPGGGIDQVMVIKHPDGTYSRYLHQGHGSDTVRKGDTVKGGQVVGSSGTRNAPHTHFEMWTGVPGGRDSKLMNPKAIFGWDRNNPAVGGREVIGRGPSSAPPIGSSARVDGLGGGKEITGGATIPKGTDPATLAAINRVAAAHGLDPAAVAAIIDTESKWNPQARTGKYTGLTQIGDYDVSHLPPDQQVEAYGKWLDSYNFNEKAKAAGVDFSKMTPAQQAAYLQGFQFAPNAMDWQRAYGAGQDTGRTTPTRQASALGDTSMRAMTEYYTRLLGQNPAQYAPQTQTPATATNRGAFKPGRETIDRKALTGAQKQEVEGGLKATVTAPPGTEVKVTGDGAFAKTETERSTTVIEPELVE